MTVIPISSYKDGDLFIALDEDGDPYATKLEQKAADPISFKVAKGSLGERDFIMVAGEDGTVYAVRPSEFDQFIKPGPSGLPGLPGLRGVRGEDGANGVDGVDGKSPEFPKGATEGDVLTWNGKAWEALPQRVGGVVNLRHRLHKLEIQTLGVGLIVNNGVNDVVTGIKGELEVPFDCNIVEGTLIGDASGSISIDVLRSTYAAFPTTVSLTASAQLTLSSAQKSQDSTLTGWTKSLNAGDIIQFNVLSATGIARCTASLKIRRR